MFKYLLLFSITLFVAYTQVVLKWQTLKYNYQPKGFVEKFQYFKRILKNPFILSAYMIAGLRFFVWLIVLRYFELSYAYPVTSINIIFIYILGIIFFNEKITTKKNIGVFLISIGVLLMSV